MTPTAWTIERAIAAASRPPRGRVPEADADQPAGRGDPAQLVVGEVARVVGRRRGRRCATRRPGAWPCASTSSIVARRRVRDVQRSGRAPPSRGRSSRPSGRQPALARSRAPTRRTPCRRSARARSCGSPASTIASTLTGSGLERVRALDREQPGGEARVGRPRREVRREVLARADEPERAARTGRPAGAPGPRGTGRARGRLRQVRGRPAGGDGHAASRRRCGRRCARC